MKNFLVFSLLFLTGCATSLNKPQWKDFELLSKRIEKIEKTTKKPEPKQDPNPFPILKNTSSFRSLTPAQKDFIILMMDYLGK